VVKCCNYISRIVFIFFASAHSFNCFCQYNRTKVTNNDSEDFHASFSPNGNTILFDSQQNGIYQVYLYDLLTKQTKQLTTDSIKSDHPVWFPDGKHILFTYWQNGAERYVMNADGSGKKKLIDNAYAIASPKGDKVSFITNRNGDYDLYTADSNGKHEKQLTSFKGDEVAMTWSPDEEYIAFMRQVNNNFQVCRIATDGSGYQQLTFDSACINLQWNPKNNLIAYSCKSGYGAVLNIMKEDGSSKMQLAACKGDISAISWSPDGKKILYASGNDEAEELAIISITNSSITQLTHNNFRDTYLSWSPDGKKILFVSNKDGDLDIYYMPLNP